MVNVTGKSYAFVGLMVNFFLLFMLVMMGTIWITIAIQRLFQGAWAEVLPVVSMLLGIVITALVYIWVWKSNGSMSLSFVDGFSNIAEGLMSGCFPLTAVYLFPVMMIVYLIALFNSIMSLFRGKTYAQERWVGMADWFGKHRIGA